MKDTFLEKIIDAKKLRIAAAKSERAIDDVIRVATSRRDGRPRFRLSSSLQRDAINVIAEIKRASPSKGVINDSIVPADVARSYVTGGASAISVLTESDFFQGSLADLRSVRQAVDVPLLMKDFVVDPYQVYQAAETGADAILLIVAALGESQIRDLHELASSLGLDVLVEVHTQSELEVAARLGANLIGVNNRDLHSFHVTLDVSRELAKIAPADALLVTESGLRSHEEVVELRTLGFSGFLIGESLMRAEDPEAELRSLIGMTEEVAS